MALNFVKFQRGSAEAYARLKTNHALEADALYFIYDKNAPAEGGLLYLGEVLIGGTGVAGASQLSELSDINLSGASLADGMILQYQQSSGKWIPNSIKSAVENSGANIGGGGSSITIQSGSTQEGQTKAQALASINNDPDVGDIVFLDGEPNIYNGSQWQVLTGSALEDRVALLEQGLSAVDGKISAAVAQANHLSYVVESELPVITQQNVDNLKNKVILVPNSNASGNDIYDEYLLVQKSGEQDKLEKLGSWNVNLANYVQVGDLANYVTQNDLSNYVTASDLSDFETVIGNTYVTKNTFNTVVGDIQDLLDNTDKVSTTIIDEVIELQNALKWVEIPTGEEEEEEQQPGAGE